MMQNVDVNLGENSYVIHIGSGLLAKQSLFDNVGSNKQRGRQIAVITNAVIADLYLPTLREALSAVAPAAVEVVILPEGEQHKNQETLNQIYDRLIEKKFSRDCLLIALGGGIVGDMTGFAAATYQRGVDFMQIPTTLLAQVDSSVGGKTGINHRLGKNLIGAFYQPQSVMIDSKVLQTLPKREMAAGMAEVIKYGLIRDSDFLTRLDNIMPSVMRLDSDALEEIIAVSCRHKANVVENDEKESGERATLNLGHTFGHAIEALTQYQRYLHGEAVAIGTMMALELSRLLGWLNEADIAFAEKLFVGAACPVYLTVSDKDREVLTPATIREAMQRDKKVKSGKLKLIVLQALGQAVIRDDIDEALIAQAIAARIA